MAEAFIIDAVRTPRATSKPDKGAYIGVHPQHLAATVMRALHERNGFDTKHVDDVIWGTSAQKGTQAGDMGRMAALDAGYDPVVSGVTLDRFCGSGLTAVNFAAGQLMSGMEDLIVAGGTEMMSVVTEVGMKEREAGLGGNGLLGTGNLSLLKKYPQSNQGLAADTIATMQGITREDLDAFGVESQRRAAIAIENGYFNKSLIPVYDQEGVLLLDKEQYPRPGTTLDDLAKLTPSFLKLADMPLDKHGTTFRKLINLVYPDVDIQCYHHAGTSSGVVDGAAALLLASGGYVARHGLKPRAKVIAMANMGDCPTLMLNAPVPAAQKVLAKAGLTKDDIDLWEVNEAFAVVVEKFIRDLDIDRDKINVNGGAIALGHPIGATGAVLIGTVLDELERRGLKRGLITMCAAGGMAPAIIIERV
ncbi:acetyl-CoA C-acetyltransferase [Halioxenophilus sp. WMMB6]|uniref:acetyl-CoA C-acetyltransferase n=1 Tax=Halioxenophilus sp. WMMB6 TaxID=3073815 RepID=UPI00295E3A2E|nr:acetyl-CoA C-acetyltransferase [Halioxenophilus sp. WMMB6]